MNLIFLFGDQANNFANSYFENFGLMQLLKAYTKYKVFSYS